MEITHEKDPKHIMKRISTFCMSDGYIAKTGNSYEIRLTSIHKEFVGYFKEVVRPITSVAITKVVDKTCKQDYFWLGRSKRHPYFYKLRDRIYRANYRGLDTHALKLFDWEAFAIWYMSDGTISMKNRPKPSGMKLCTDRLTYSDNIFLRNIIRKNLQISCEVRAQGPNKWRLVFFSKDYYKIFSNIKPFILPCFMYKVPNDELLNYYRDRYE